MVNDMMIGRDEARHLASAACAGAGADASSTHSLVEATISAASFGPPNLGFPHFVDYLDAFAEGRINRNPRPSFSRQRPGFLVSDADFGIAQLGFDIAYDALVKAAEQNGIAIFTQTGSYTAGELGYYVRRLAGKGLVGLAATNANALMTPKAGVPAVYSTNPLAFGFPLGEGRLPLVIDQASSATAYVNVVRAAAEGQAIPAGWAVDRNGNPTEDAADALSGALLPFGDRKGGNIALMVEMLSAGLSGGPWSIDTVDFRSGNASPAVGLTVMAIMTNPSQANLTTRAQSQTERLGELGVFLPGITGLDTTGEPEEFKLPRAVFDNINRFAERA